MVTSFIPAAADVLLRRRWRAEYAFARLTLIRLGWTDGPLMRWYSGDLRALPSHVAIRRLLSISFLIDIVLSVPIALGLTFILPEGTPASLSVLVAAILGIIVGAGSGRRMGLFPFDALRRLSPLDDSATASLLTRTEVRYLLHRRVISWFPVSLAVLLSSLHTASPLGALLSFSAFLISGFVFAYGVISGGRLATALARSRATGHVELRRWLVAMLASLGLGATGWLLTALLAFNALNAVWATITSPSDLLEDGPWKRTVDEFFVRVNNDASGILTFVDSLLAHSGSLITFSALAFFLVLTLISRLSAVMIPTDRSGPSRPSGDAVAMWLSYLSHSTAHEGIPTRVLVRRMLRQRWALAQHFWTIILPTPEAAFFLGGAVGLLGVAQNTWTAAALLAMAGTMAAHNQATELRAELMPALGMSAERATIPLLLSAPDGKGIAAAVRARRRLLTRHIFPAGALVAAFLICVAMFHGLPPWAALGVGSAVAAAYGVAPAVQWYMGAALIPDAYAEREFEQGTGSSTVILQSTLQGLPRIALVVLPSFALVTLIVLGPLVPIAAGALLLCALVFLPLLTLPFLLFIERYLAKRVGKRGLQAWRNQ